MDDNGAGCASPGCDSGQGLGEVRWHLVQAGDSLTDGCIVVEVVVTGTPGLALQLVLGCLIQL